MDEIIELSGTVVGILYRNEDNGYTVIKLKTENENIINSVGYFSSLNVGERLLLSGLWTTHPEYGPQFKIEIYETILPSEENDIYVFLASGAIKGVGPATASLLVQKFGRRIFEVIESGPEELTKVKGISEKRAVEICEEFKKISGIKKLSEYLSMYNIKPIYTMKLYKYFGEKAYDIIQENPYILINDFIGADFPYADDFAINIGVEENSLIRLSAASLFELKHNLNNGHVFIPRNKLIAATSSLLNCNPELVSLAIDELIYEGQVIEEELNGVTACYLSKLYEAETSVFQRVLYSSNQNCKITNSESIDLNYLEQQNGIKYSELQKQAIYCVLNNNLSIITGGPGTGKTTIINAICSVLEERDLKIILAAPTGRAAKRLSQVTNRDAATIHRILECKMADDNESLFFQRDESNQLVCDALIVDESSMIDIMLMKALFDAVPFEAKIVLVGDADQLPSVGPGNVFSDLIRSGKVATIALNNVFRQDKQSNIILYAHQINKGIHPNLNENTKGFFRLQRNNSDQSKKTLMELCSIRLPQKLGIAQEDIQVLSPTKKGPLGTKALNMILQEQLNPPGPKKVEKKFYDIIFRTGDRVMQIRNNYDIQWSSESEDGLGIFNGDIGYINSIDLLQEKITVDFDGKIANYDFSLLNELEHAWAITIHKSQGSEYKAVIIVMSNFVPNLLTRNILYTGVSRARELLIILGEDEDIYYCIDNNKVQKRYSGLKLRLMDY